MKTVRFTEIVRRAGRPRVHTLWLEPEKDPELTRARKATRVMTLVQPARGKTESGVVGFEPAPAHGSAEYLIFPKSLRAFEGAKVVGLKFDLVEQPKLVPATAHASKPPAKKSRAARKRSEKSPRPTRRAPHSEGGAGSPSRPEFPRPTPARNQLSTRAAAESRSHSQTSVPAAAVRAALAELERGNAVAAYRRLQHALAAENGTK